MEAALASCLLVAAAEMGDKTQLLAFVLAARLKRPWPILAGILVATVANHTLAAGVGSVAGNLIRPTALAWIVGVLFIGRFYGIPVGVRELGIVAAASVLVSFAAPGVPRGAFLLLTPLFLAIGLPAEGIGVLIAVDLIPDMCTTVVNVTGDVTATALVASRERAAASAD